MKCSECKFVDTNTYRFLKFFCRRYPPVLIIDSDDEYRYGYPYVDRNDWCGEFKSRKEL